jgi:hypothetical protein
MELEKAAIISESGEGGISAKHKELDATIAVITVIQHNVLNSLISPPHYSSFHSFNYYCI